jgi:preprotein translocase subunit SecA
MDMPNAIPPLANRAQPCTAPTHPKQDPLQNKKFAGESSDLSGTAGQKSSFAVGLQKALQTKETRATKDANSQSIAHLPQLKLSGFKVSHSERHVDEILKILTDFRGPSSQVKYPLGDEAVETIKKQRLLVKKFEQEIEDCSDSQLKKLIIKIKQDLNPSNQISSPSPEQPICQLLAIAQRVFAQCFNIEPYHVQILAVLGILASKGDFKGCLAQIKTGEGKSTVITLVALILACQGKCIDVITSTEYLAKRDERKYKPFFKFFEITTSQLCDKTLTPDNFSGQIVYGTNYNFEFSTLFDKLSLTANRTLYNDGKNSRPFHVAIVDEVDNMLLDKAANSARISTSSQQNLTALYPIIYDYVKDNCALKAPDMGIISDCAGLVEKYKLSETQLGLFIDSAYQACFKYEVNEDYCLRKQARHFSHDENSEVVIIDKDTGRLCEGSRWQHGLHQFLEYKHGLPMQEETLTLGALSHPAFFAYYEEIYGVTGSLGASIERNEVTEMYGLTSFDVPTHKPPLSQQLPTLLCDEKGAFNRTLLREVLDMTKAGRPCLVLCRSIAVSHILYQLIKPEVSDLKLLNDVQNEDEDFLIALAAHSAAVTIATNAAGRGTDITVSEKSAKNGGLHVIFTFFPHSERVEIQGAGRAGRQGTPGSYRIIVPHDDALLANTGSGKIEELIALRKEMVGKASLTRRQYAAIHVAQHNILERFCQAFRDKFSRSFHRHAVLNKWAEFYTPLEDIEVERPVNLAHDVNTALLAYQNTLNSVFETFMKSLPA